MIKTMGLVTNVKVICIYVPRWREIKFEKFQSFYYLKNLAVQCCIALFLSYKTTWWGEQKDDNSGTELQLNSPPCHLLVV